MQSLVRTYSLTSAAGASALVSNLGCILLSLKIPDNDGRLRETVLGFDHLSHYYSEAYLRSYVYFGAIIGRYANRICNGRFELNGKTYFLARNAGEHTLHGGSEGFDRKIWNVTYYDPTPGGRLVMEYHSPDGEEGFPGNLRTRIMVRLKERSLHYEITGVTDAPTPVNLTWHTYFNLDEHHAHSGDQLIRVPAHGRLVQDETLCPTGEVKPPVTFTDDISDWTAVSSVPHLDSTFTLKSGDPHLTLAAEALSSDRQLHLQVYTDQPAVHVYTGSGNPRLKGRNNVDYGPGNGYCFETQLHPDALNHAHFPNAVLQPGETYLHRSSYVFA